MEKINFVSPRYAALGEVEEAQKSFDEYESSRAKIIEMLSRLDDKSTDNKVDGRVVSKISLVGEKLDTVQIDFIDIEGWLSSFEDGKNIAYSVVLSPSDPNYHSGCPIVRIVHCESAQTNVSDIDFNTGTPLSPHLGSNTPRSTYIANEPDLSAAVGFVTEIFEEKLKKTE